MELYLEGTAITDIAKMMEVSRETIYQWMARPAFVEELDRLIELQRKSFERKLHSLEHSVYNTIKLGLVEDIGAPRVNMAKYTADRILGQPTSRVQAVVSPEASAWLQACALGSSDEEEGE